MSMTHVFALFGNIIQIVLVIGEVHSVEQRDIIHTILFLFLLTEQNCLPSSLRSGENVVYPNK